MDTILETALCRSISGLVLLFVIAPTTIVFLHHLVSIVPEAVRELRK